MRLRSLAPALALALLGTACAPRPASREARVIACLGDSITAGITKGSSPPERDPLGGYPGRLQRRLQGRVRVLNRGIGGATTMLWLSDPRTARGQALWSLARWDDFGASAPPPDAASIALAVLEVDRPDLVILLLGVNDVGMEHGAAGAGVADPIGARLEDLYRQARTLAPTVLVATVLPNRRDPPEVGERLNARIRAAHPDFLPLGERFAAAGWEQLLGDLVHPNEQGCEVLADIVATELGARGLVRL